MKLDYKKTILVGLAFLSISSFWQLYDQVVPLMLEYTFGITGFVNGGIMAADNVLALILLPIFGSLSDKTKTRWGRRMPFIVFGSFAACATMMLVPLANNIASLPLFVVGLGITLLFISTYRSPAVALMPDVTPKPLRSKGNAVINLMGVVGTMLALGLGRILLPPLAEGSKEYHANYIPYYLAVMAIMVISVVCLLISTNEPKLTKKMQEDSIKYGVEDAAEEAVSTEKRPMEKGKRKALLLLMASIALWFMGYNAVTTYFSRYCIEIMGMGPGDSGMVLMLAQAAAVVTFIPSGIIATKIGRKKTIMAGIVLLAIAFGTATVFTSFSPVIYVQFALAGIAWACINVNSLPMVVDLARMGEIGRFTGFYYAASMTAQIATPMLARTLMDIDTRILLPYGAVFVALSFITMIFVKYGDSRPAKAKKGLEAFGAMDD